MDSGPENPDGSWSRGERIYAAALFAAAALALAFALTRGVGSPWPTLGVPLFFLLYGLFTIAIGYQHPRLGYYSFDRVAQVAAILVLGPVQAALVNGLASLLYPWHRLSMGVPLRHVFYASLNNAGLMSLITLVAGSIYVGIGGNYPLTSLSGRGLMAVAVLVLAMQLLNDAGMLALLKLGRKDLTGFFNSFLYALELGSGATAILVAVVYNAMETSVFVLLLGVLSLGMLALRQFANMRHRLELIVAERTHSLREKTLELERQATHDNLTDLFNRRYADEYLAREVERVERHRERFSIALGDIDLFKQINDRHSHATGDAVLKRVAGILRARCREADMIARYGGEEFLICFPNTDLAEANAVCEALRTAVETSGWAQLGLAAGVTISFGIAAHRPGLSRDKLLDAADLRLYEAKHGGRNLVVA